MIDKVATVQKTRIGARIGMICDILTTLRWLISLGAILSAWRPAIYKILYDG